MHEPYQLCCPLPQGPSSVAKLEASFRRPLLDYSPFNTQISHKYISMYLLIIHWPILLYYVQFVKEMDAYNYNILWKSNIEKDVSFIITFKCFSFVKICREKMSRVANKMAGTWEFALKSRHSSVNEHVDNPP